MAASQRHKIEQSGTIHFTCKEKKRGPRENPQRNPRPTRTCKKIVVTRMQPETAPLMAKRAQNAARKIA